MEERRNEDREKYFKTSNIEKILKSAREKKNILLQRSKHKNDSGFL